MADREDLLPAPGAFDCRDVGGLLAAWVDGELDPSEKAAFDAHLLACPGCARAARGHLGLKQAVRRTSSGSHAPARLRTSISARLQDERLPLGPALLQRAGALEPRTVALAAGLAGVLTWFAAGGLTRPVLGASPAQRALEEGVAQHAGTLPLDFAASDAGAVQRWLQSRLDYNVRLPRFPAQSGSRTPSIQGARLSIAHSRPAAVIRYAVPDAEQRRISLVVVDDPAAEPAGEPRRLAGHEVWVSRSRGFNVATWRHDEIVYSLISDLEEQDVLDLVRAAQER